MKQNNEKIKPVIKKPIPPPMLPKIVKKLELLIKEIKLISKISIFH